MTVHVNVTPNGRMSLPADIRRRLGLTGGGAVYLDETDEGVVLRTMTQAVSRAQAMSRALLDEKEAATVDEFVAERRQWQE